MIVDVYHDTVCPWCRIGKARLDRAIADWGGPVAVRWHPFFLDASLPEEGVPFREYFVERKGIDDPEPLFERVRRIGAGLGLDFRFDTVRLATNTLRSHRLIALAPEPLKPATIDALHRAYFADGRDIGDVETLADLAAEVGIDREEVAAALRGDAARAEVLAEAAASRRPAMFGVPVFVFDGRVVVSGAQPAETLLEAMREAAPKRAEVPHAETRSGR